MKFEGLMVKQNPTYFLHSKQSKVPKDKADTLFYHYGW